VKTMYWISQAVLLVGEFIGLLVFANDTTTIPPTMVYFNPIIVLYLFIGEVVVSLLYLLFTDEEDKIRFITFIVVTAVFLGIAVALIASFTIPINQGTTAIFEWFYTTAALCLPISALVWGVIIDVHHGLPD